MLKIATPDDYEVVMDMAMAFLATTDMAPYATREETSKIISMCLDQSNLDTSIVILHGNDGMILGALNAFPFGPIIMASEIGWWVNPDKRKSNVGAVLLEAFEEWAKKVGANFVNMVSLDDKVGRYYEKKGYKLLEHAYIKEI